MKRKAIVFNLLAIAFFSFRLTAAADTFDSKWKSPDAEPVTSVAKKSPG